MIVKKLLDMKLLKPIISVLIIFLCSGFIFAQNVEFDKDNFKSNKDGLKEAVRNIKAADDYYKLGRKGTYALALEPYLKAQRFNPNNAALNNKIGVCYLNSVQKVKCIEYFQTAYKLNPHVADDILYNLGRGFHLNLEFDKAIAEYTKFKNRLSPKELEQWRGTVAKRIEECEVGKELVLKPVRVFIDNAGNTINSSYPDYTPTISADESTMIFTSRRPSTTGGARSEDDQQYFEDIYISYNNNGTWSTPKNIGKPINDNNHDAVVGLSPDGQQLFVYYGAKGGDIYVSQLKGDEWSKPKMLNKNVNTDYQETSASFSFNGKTMYFISDDEERSYGGKDIFITYLGEKGKWEKSKNLGAAINTKYDEEGVFMHPDGRTMYFSSQGHNSMGGYDIFKSVMDDNGNWSKPENLGYPINTPDDDVFFVINASGKNGYYSSGKEGGVGEKDIYKITFRGPEKPLVQSNEDNLIASETNPVSEVVIEEAIEIITTRLTILKGTIKDALSLNPVEASIEIIDNEKNEVIFTSNSNSSTGNYLVSLPSGKNYGIAVKAQDYLFHSENFDIAAATNYQEITKDILLNKMAVGSKIILKNIFFDYAKATLRPESYSELDRLLKLLNDFPTTRIEISGHTDNQGSLKTNKSLSERRAKAVVDYLIAKGISASRLEFKGLFYSQPVATNDTEEGRQQNRRVEFKVLSK